MLRIVPLGGLGEIGLNAMVLETADEAVLIDCGLMFPQADAFGVDLVVPDLRYVLALGDKLKAVFLTHGHEDHVGALPLLLRDRPVPVHASPFTLALLDGKLRELGLRGDLRELPAGERREIGHDFVVEGVRVTHSIPDGLGLAVDTPEGLIVHTGDFKIDHTPVDDRPTDLARFGQLGRDGVTCLLSDSTNSDRPGVTMSERQVGVAFERLFARAKARVVISTFASNVHRVQLALDLARRFGRKVVLLGRAMQHNVKLASELGLLEVPLGLIVDAEEGRRLRHDQVAVLCTGAQGEPRSALARLALGDASLGFSLDEGDLIVLSSRFIPGNEVAIGNVLNHLARLGCELVYPEIADIHTSGHAHVEEQKLMLRLTQPRHFVPIHGEWRHLLRHARTAQEIGLPERDCHVIGDGDVLQFEGGRAFRNGTVPAGRVYVEGRAGPDVPEPVLQERSLLAETGLVTAVVAIDARTGAVLRPVELSGTGLAVPDREKLWADARREVEQALGALSSGLRTDVATVQEEVRRAVRRAFRRETEKRPVVLPVVIEL